MPDMIVTVSQLKVVGWPAHKLADWPFCGAADRGRRAHEPSYRDRTRCDDGGDQEM